MATEAQIRANRENALKSTGPKTAEGKSNSARNSVLHGFYSRRFVILPGEEDEFDSFLFTLQVEIAPATPLEEILFQQLAQAAWNIERCHKAEAALAAYSPDPEIDPLLDDRNEAKLRRIDSCLRRSQSAFHKNLNQLRAIQAVRKASEQSSTAADSPSPAIELRKNLEERITAFLQTPPQAQTPPGPKTNAFAAATSSTMLEVSS